MTLLSARGAALMGAMVALLALTGLAGSAAHATVPSATTASATASATASPALARSPIAGDPAHPYSDPIWFPLRDPARVSCVVSNCTDPLYHGYQAIDWLGQLDAPVHPAGAGVFHVGAVTTACPASGVTAGTWAWVDHGPAGVTRYDHLNRLLAKEGQLVTPATVMATMGHNGNTYPCKTNYLHLQYRGERLSGPILPVPSMRACSGTQPISLPSAMGFTAGWNSIKPNVHYTPTVGDDCLPSSWSLTPSRPTLSALRGVSSVRVTPSARPSGVTAVRVRIELYHPTLKAYGLPKYRTIPATQRATTFSSLLPGRTYRFSLAFHNASGWSAWAPARTAVPAERPSTPRFRGVSASSSTISHLWYRSTSRGTDPATYVAARRCYVHGAWRSWTYARVAVPKISQQWRGLPRHTTCQVTVRAYNVMGHSGWQTRKSIRTT
ncbi:peptidoglycan DD-metalloendopeptidase family protein [Angustibacter sp. Root456]|uniref:peptidoglycan DD-metalloendopeptidase family protein n=1 Tax=Angustibacter sp. Root456 TaxID=1736539 RepID=UPI0006FBFEA5|nr:peptidoglycan DD-metalloendopeptidase family protein [Angustibacter sp. Root456]KQX68587.1 hypothetical protein ASD06_17835 [Angustibacter sp. Root456]